MAKGGKRPGAGRPVGAASKRYFRDSMKKIGIEEFFEFALYIQRKREADRLDGDQLIGKATQALTGPDGDLSKSK